MASKVELLVPEGAVKIAPVPPARRLKGLEGKVLGVINNGKPNADIFLSRLAGRLKKEYKISGIVSRLKPRVAVPAEFIEELAGKCHGVVNAMGD